ncbi:MAG: hypothetical protein JWM27_1824 [Gemmatimonadetes bacterium]|nr:hypothetical protein [Gemmatimonadota bacterium]
MDRLRRRLGVWKVRSPVVMDAVGGPRAEPEPLAEGEPCANCGDRTPGNFCRRCGQARRVVHVSLREMATDFLDDQLALNSKLPVTVAWLLLRPGYLTREYLKGRIASYIRPLRLYLGASVMFFVVFSFLAQREGWGLNGHPGPLQYAGSDSAEVGDSVRAALKQAGVRPPAAPAPPVAAAPKGPPRSARRIAADSARAAAAARDNEDAFGGMGAVSDTLNAKWRRLRNTERPQIQRAVLDGVQTQGPRAMFLMLPIFAFILKVLYAGSKRFYVEHFVFALHFHAFVFLLLTIVLGLEEIPALRGSQLGPLLWLWSVVYLFVAMKTVYGQGFFKTGVKYFTLFWAYLFALTLGFIVTAMTIVFFM